MILLKDRCRSSIWLSVIRHSITANNGNNQQLRPATTSPTYNLGISLVHAVRWGFPCKGMTQDKTRRLLDFQSDIQLLQIMRTTNNEQLSLQQHHPPISLCTIMRETFQRQDTRQDVVGVLIFILTSDYCKYWQQPKAALARTSPTK